MVLTAQQMVTSSTMLPPPAPTSRGPKLSAIKSEPLGHMDDEHAPPIGGPVLEEATSSIPDLGEYLLLFYGNFLFFSSFWSKIPCVGGKNYQRFHCLYVSLFMSTKELVKCKRILGLKILEIFYYESVSSLLQGKSSAKDFVESPLPRHKKYDSHKSCFILGARHTGMRIKLEWLNWHHVTLVASNLRTTPCTHTPEINAWIESQGRALEEAWKSHFRHTERRAAACPWLKFQREGGGAHKGWKKLPRRGDTHGRDHVPPLSQATSAFCLFCEKNKPVSSMTPILTQNAQAVKQPWKIITWERGARVEKETGGRESETI
jgi:hypothetical protein